MMISYFTSTSPIYDIKQTITPSTLARISNSVNIEQRKLLMNSYITSYFNYCPLAWICHGRKPNNNISRVQDQALRVIVRTINPVLNPCQRKTIPLLFMRKIYNICWLKLSELKWVFLLLL